MIKNCLLLYSIPFFILNENSNKLNENSNKLNENSNKLNENSNKLNENSNKLNENSKKLREFFLINLIKQIKLNIYFADFLKKMILCKILFIFM